MKPNITKSSLYEHVARIGKALSSPKRLELIELLAQGEKTVDTLAQQARIDMRLASAHLKALREFGGGGGHGCAPGWYSRHCSLLIWSSRWLTLRRDSARSCSI